MERVRPSSLESFCRAALEALGTPRGIAERVATSLVDADRTGHGSHGVVRLPWYAEHVEDGAIDPGAEPTVEALGGPLAHVDGGAAFGQIVAERATEVAAERAAEHGVGVVGLRTSAHLGRLGEQAERAAGADLLFASLVNLQGGSQRIAPPGSADRRLGTNPITFGVPSFGALSHPLVLDAATSQVAHGKIIERDETGERLPGAWTITGDGEPVSVATEFEDGMGALLPLGGRATGHKGWGLAIVAELWAAALGNAPVSTEPEQDWLGSAGAFLAVDPTAFAPREELRERVEGLVSHLRSADRPLERGASAHERALLPGEAEYRRAERAREAGVHLRDPTIETLRDLAVELGVEGALPRELRD